MSLLEHGILRISLAVVLVCGLFLTAHPIAAARPASSSSRASRREHPRTGRVPAPFAELVRAVRKNDRAALERLASHMGPARLGEALASQDEGVARAALAAVPLTRGRVLLAGALADRLAVLDRGDRTEGALAAAAARALGELFDGSAPAELDEWEVPPDVVDRACAALRGLAARLEAPVPTRLAALDALAVASRVCTSTAELAPLLRDPVPAVRRAAALIVRPGERQAAAALRDVLHDADPAVASAAAAAVCRAEASRAREKGDALVQQSVAAARALVSAPTTPADDAVEMLACVAAAGTPADRALLDELRRGPPSPLRDRAAALAESGGSVKPE